MKKKERNIKIAIVITGCLLVSSVVIPMILAGGLHVEIEIATVIMGILFGMAILSGIIMSILIARIPSSLNKYTQKEIILNTKEFTEFDAKIQGVLQIEYERMIFALDQATLQIFHRKNRTVLEVVCILDILSPTKNIVDIANQQYIEYISSVSLNINVNTIVIVVAKEKIKNLSHYLKEGNCQELKNGRLFAFVDLYEQKLIYNKLKDSLYKKKQIKLENSLLAFLEKADLLKD